MFETRMPRKSASRQDPKVIVNTPNNSRMPFGIVTVFARRMLAYERLERLRRTSPRASNRRAASISLSPIREVSTTVTIGSHYRRPARPTQGSRSSPSGVPRVAGGDSGGAVVPALPDDPLAGLVDDYNAVMPVVGGGDVAVGELHRERGAIKRSETSRWSVGPEGSPVGRECRSARECGSRRPARFHLEAAVRPRGSPSEP